MGAKRAAEMTVQEFAELVGKKRQTIYQWIDKGLPHRRSRGTTFIVPSKGIEWYIEYTTWELQEQRRDPSGRNKDLPNAKEEAALTARATRLIKEHELLEMTSQVVPKTELIEFIETMMGTFSGVAAGRLQSFERDMVRVSSIAEARKLTQKIHAELMAGALSYGDRLDAEAIEIEREAALSLGAKSLDAVNDTATSAEDDESDLELED